MSTVMQAPTLTLRPYQEEAVARTLDQAAAGHLRQLGVAATGLGKTVIFCEVARRRGLPTLVLAHRDELLGQAVEKVRWAWPEASVGLVQGPVNEFRRDVVVASVQTLARIARLQRVQPRFGTVIVDEAHHAAAASYRRVLDHLVGPDSLLLGVTATPDRGDRRGLSDVFDHIAWTYDIAWGVDNQHLCDLRGLRVGMDLDLTGVARRGGDYADGALGEALEAANAPEHVAEAWANHAQGRRGLVFCPTIALASASAEALSARGVRAASVSGIDLGERRRLLAALRAGALDAITNCAVLTEGFDEPRVDCIVIARPTTSRALYVQMVGRGTRNHVDKADCLILDVVGATGRHDLMALPSLFGLRPEEVREGESIAEAMQAHREREAKAGRLVAEDVDLFRRLRANRTTWVRASGAYAANAGDRIVVLRRLGDGEEWEARALAKGEAPVVLAEGVTLEQAQGAGEDFVRTNKPAALRDPNAPWRQRPPSPKALAAARRWRVRINPDWNAGELSEAMDRRVAEARIREATKAGA